MTAVYFKVKCNFDIISSENKEQVITQLENINPNSLDINPNDTYPNENDRATFFSDVYYRFVEYYGLDSQGEFHLANDSPAIDFANTESGITYDIDFLPRDFRPDAGAREYIELE